MSLVFHFPYAPVAQPRSRISTRNGKPFAYVPGNHPVNNYKDGMRKWVKSKLPKPLEGPITISLAFYLKKAKSNKMDRPEMKPDIDNLAKAVLDALNGVAYHDDKQICKLVATKDFAIDHEPGVYIFIGRYPA